MSRERKSSQLPRRCRRTRQVLRAGAILTLLWAGRGLAQRDSGERRPEDPVLREAIEISTPDERGRASVRGRAGCVPPGRWVVVHTLDTEEFVCERADGEGRFSVDTFAPIGSVLQIHHRARRADPPEIEPDPTSSPAIIIDRAPSNSAGRAADFDAAAVWRLDAARAWVRCRISSVRAMPGEMIRVAGELRVLPLAEVSVVQPLPDVELSFELCRLYDEAGRPLAPVRLLASAFLTPGGLPVEAPEDVSSLPCGECRIPSRELELRSSTIRGRFATGVRADRELPSGHYLLGCRLHVSPEAFRCSEPPARSFQEAQIFLPARLAILRIGAPRPPRLAILMLPEKVSNGSRGVLPQSAERSWAISPAAVFQAPLSAFPPRHPDGRPVAFRFEPGLPLISLANRPFPLTIPRPLVPFRLPGGEWKVALYTPSGRAIEMGPSSFTAGRNELAVLDPASAQPARDAGPVPFAYGNNYLGDVYQLTPAERQAFRRHLEEYGEYTIETEGFILDRFGHRYDLGGRFRFAVADALDLDLGFMPGTPLRCDERFPALVHIRPPLPAEVRFELRHFPGSQREGQQTTVVEGRANPYGYFAPPDPRLCLAEPGEYVLDITASHRGRDGTLRMACLRGASIVVPERPLIIAHGERGLRSPRSTQRPVWYIEGLRRDVVREPGAGMHAVFPYHHGDVLWVEDHESIFPAIRFDDPSGELADLVESLRPEVREGTYSGFFNHELKPIDMRVLGELPLFSRGTRGWPIGQFPAHPEYVSYAFTTTFRPGVFVRSLVHESSFLAYWSLDDPYNLQFGGGAEGDLPGDFKMQYAGVVLRGGSAGAAAEKDGGAPGPRFPQYAAYGSMAIIVERGDRLGNRVTPPFGGASGGPNGGPLLTIRGRDYHLFVTPTGVLPGSVCETGQRFVYCGYVWPPLPADVSWSVTGPQGRERSFDTTASPMGYFQDERTDFVLAAPGIHAHRVSVRYRGATSAGVVTEPFPRGDLPGSEEGRSHFVVVDEGEPPLAVAVTPLMASSPDRSGSGANQLPARYLFRASIPAGWREARGLVSVWMPGVLLDDSTFPVPGEFFHYALDAERLGRDFSNIDPGPVDTFVVTLAATGKDAAGSLRTRARVLVIQGGECLPAGSAKPHARQSGDP